MPGCVGLGRNFRRVGFPEETLFCDSDVGDGACHCSPGVAGRRAGVEGARGLTRGRLEVGGEAGLILFDLATIRDTGTFEDPIRYPAGVEAVLVKDTVVVEPGQNTGALADLIVRRPPRP